MLWLAQTIFLTCLYQIKCSCVLDHRTLEEVWEKKLHNDLLRGYKWRDPPNSCNFTDVKIGFKMRNFKLDSDTEIFTMQSDMMLLWTDERRKWNPKDYGGLTHIYSVFSEQWIPLVELHNKYEDYFSSFYFPCKAQHTGLITCTPRIVSIAVCETDMSDWPYDTQSCTLEFRVRGKQKTVHLIPFQPRAVSMLGADYGPEFTIVDYHQVSNTSDKVQLRVTFVLDRNGEALAAIVIFPAILLAVLATSSIVMDVNNWPRWFMVLFSMFCHCYYMSELGWKIPKHSRNPPTILMFYRASLILTLLLIFATVIIRKVRNKITPPPSFISSVYSFVFNTHAKHFVWPRWQTNVGNLSEDIDVKCVEVWNGFANIVNSVCIFVSITVYSIMISVWVPRQQPFT